MELKTINQNYSKTQLKTAFTAMFHINIASSSFTSQGWNWWYWY